MGHHQYDEDGNTSDDPSILCMSVSNDGEMLASGDSTGLIKLWKLKTGKCLRKYRAFDFGTAVMSLRLSSDSSRILSGSVAGSCREFGTISTHLLRVLDGHKGYVQDCHY